MSLPIPADTPVPTLFSLSDRVAAITGGSRGIGLSAAYALAEAGADVAILYTTSSTAEQTATEIAHRTGRKVQAYRANVVSQQEIATAFDEILTDFGRLDVVVANAGVSGVAPVLEAGKADYEAIVKTNLDGAFWTAQAAGRIFERQERRLNDGENGASISRGFRGNLIFTASMSALIVNVPQRQAVYNASKAAVVQLAKSLAVEWVERGWRVNCISPGTVATDLVNQLSDDWKGKWLDMIPANRFCQPHELKGIYVFLASDASSYVTGANLVIDGGYTLC